MYFETSLALRSPLAVTPVTVSTFEVVDVWPLLHLMVAGVAAAGLPALAKSILQFVAVLAFKVPLLLPLVMPPPEQPVMLATVVVVGFTVALELVGGSPGLYVCVPLNDLHFGSTVFAAPAGPAASNFAPPTCPPSPHGDL